MGQPLSMDLRVRLLAAIDGEMSRFRNQREAAEGRPGRAECPDSPLSPAKPAPPWVASPGAPPDTFGRQPFGCCQTDT